MDAECEMFYEFAALNIDASCGGCQWLKNWMPGADSFKFFYRYDADAYLVTTYVVLTQNVIFYNFYIESGVYWMDWKRKDKNHKKWFMLF